jgi:ASC-1-like (ASCH) protein
MLTLSVQKIYFDAIVDGIKTVEGRINTPKFKTLKPLDYITFIEPDSNETIICQVTGLGYYPDFMSMLQTEGLCAMLPGVISVEQGVALYESFPSYQEKVKEFGALAIRLQVC